MSVDKIRHSHTYCARCAEAERDEWKARAELAEAKVRAVEAIKPISVPGGPGSFARGFNHALELVAEAIASVEPSPPEDGQT